MFKLFTTAAFLIAVAACLFGDPASALTQTDEVLAQATQTPTAAPKAPATSLPKSTGTAPTPQTPAAQAGLVDINSANETDLQRLRASPVTDRRRIQCYFLAENGGLLQMRDHDAPVTITNPLI